MQASYLVFQTEAGRLCAAIRCAGSVVLASAVIVEEKWSQSKMCILLCLSALRMRFVAFNAMVQCCADELATSSGEDARCLGEPWVLLALLFATNG